jgi:type VI secretion system protein ImpA
VADDSAAAGSPPVIPVEELLQPIPGDSPAGADIRADSTPASLYYKIKDARTAARQAERAALVDTGEDAPTADWSKVLEVAPEVLKGKAKDLEVAAWYSEALVREYGFPGLRDGFRLMKGLVEQFWDGLFPLPDEEGTSTRVAPVTGLNGYEGEGTLIQPILAVPVTEGSSAGPFATWQYNQALEIEKIADAIQKQKRIDAGGVSWDSFQKAVRETPASYFHLVRADVQAALADWEALTAALDAKAGGDAPPGGNVRSTLQSVLDAMGDFARDALAAPPSGAEGGEGEIPVAGAAGAGGGGGGGGGGPPASREQAFKQLQEVAGFFRRTEPHSPLSYSLDQAVRWGRMPLPELLAELIPDEGVRDQFFKLTGIRVEKPPE